MGVGPVLVVLAVAAGAFAQSISGFGFSLIATPACALLLGPWHGLRAAATMAVAIDGLVLARERHDFDPVRSEEHTSELQSLMRSSYHVFCLIQNIIHTIIYS